MPIKEYYGKPKSDNARHFWQICEEQHKVRVQRIFFNPYGENKIWSAILETGETIQMTSPEIKSAWTKREAKKNKSKVCC